MAMEEVQVSELNVHVQPEAVIGVSAVAVMPGGNVSVTVMVPLLAASP